MIHLLQAPSDPQGPGSRASPRSSSPLPLLTQFLCEEAAKGLVLIRHPPLQAAALNLTVAEHVKWCLLFQCRLGKGSFVPGRGCPWGWAAVPLGWPSLRGVQCEIPEWVVPAVAMAAQRLAGARSLSVWRPWGGFAAWLRSAVAAAGATAGSLGDLGAVVLGEIFHVTDSLLLL